MTTEQNAVIDLDSLDLSVDAAKPEKRPPFPGVVTVDTREPGNGENGVVAKWHLAVKPLTFSVKGELGSFHNYVAVKLDENGKPRMTGEYGRVTAPIRKNFGRQLSGVQFGKGQLLGLVGWWHYEVQEYGQFSGRYPSLILERAATEEEIAEFGTTGNNQTSAKAANYSADEIESALSLLDGKKPAEWQRTVMKADLVEHVKHAILGGDMQTWLVANGYAEQSGSVINRIAVTA